MTTNENAPSPSELEIEASEIPSWLTAGSSPLRIVRSTSDRLRSYTLTCTVHADLSTTGSALWVTRYGTLHASEHGVSCPAGPDLVTLLER